MTNAERNPNVKIQKAADPEAAFSFKLFWSFNVGRSNFVIGLKRGFCNKL
jgi:hypothetical protein